MHTHTYVFIYIYMVCICVWTECEYVVNMFSSVCVSRCVCLGWVILSGGLASAFDNEST